MIVDDSQNYHPLLSIIIRVVKRENYHEVFEHAQSELEWFYLTREIGSRILRAIMH